MLVTDDGDCEAGTRGRALVPGGRGRLLLRRERHYRGAVAAAHLPFVLAAGSDGVRVGARFVAAAESDALQEYVEALIAVRPEGTLYTRAFSAPWLDAPPPRAAFVRRSRCGVPR